MSSHYNYQMPNEDDRQKWFFFNAHQSQCDGRPPVILPEMVREIYNKGFTRIYLSMGAKFAEAQEKIQKLSDFQEKMEEQNQLEGIEFEAVVIDSLNPPHSSIKSLFPCASEECYLMGEDRGVFEKRFVQSWTEDGPQAVNPWKLEETHPSRVIFNELARGPNCSYRNYRTMCQNSWLRLLDKPLQCYVYRNNESLVAL